MIKVVKVVESWETNEILLVNEGNQYLLYGGLVVGDRWLHGVSKKGSIAISLKEALQLLYDLEIAIENYENLDEKLGKINAII